MAGVLHTLAGVELALSTVFTHMHVKTMEVLPDLEDSHQIVSLETMAYYDIAHKSMLGWYVCLIHDFVTHLPQHTRSSSINQLTKGLQGIQPAYPPCIPTLPKHSSESRACTRATGWAPPIWYSELLHSTEYQLVANPLDWDYIVLLGCWAQSHSYKNTLILILYYYHRYCYY